MTELTASDMLRSGLALRHTDVLAVAEILAHQLAQEHAHGRYHGDIGPHTVLLTLTGLPQTSPARSDDRAEAARGTELRVQDARLADPHPGARPADWPSPPEGPRRDGPADIFALGQVLRALGTTARSDDAGPPAFVWHLVDPDPARRPSAGALLTAFDEGRIGLLPRSPSPADLVAPTATPAPVAAANADVAGQGRPWPLALAAVAVFALVLGAGVWWSSQDDPAPSVRAVGAGTDQASLAGSGDSGAATTEPGRAGGAGEPGVVGDPPTDTDWATADPSTGNRQGTGATGGEPETAQSGPEATSAVTSGQPPSVPGMVAPSEAAEAAGATEFDQAWCRSHGTFVARARTDSFAAVICRDGDVFNYHGLNLTDGLPIRTPALESESGWTGLGEDGVTYEVTPQQLTVRGGDGEILAREEVFNFLDHRSVGAFRPGDLMLREPNSYPACDGSALIVIDTFSARPDLHSAISKSLVTNPGSAYLSTTTSCDSLERPSYQVTDTGEMYLTYYLVPGDKATACEAIDALGTHGFWLRDDVAPGQRIECG